MYRSVAVLLGVLLVTGSAVVWSQDIVFYDDFESGDTAGWWAPARVGETGQTRCYDQAGVLIACAGTGQDGDLQPGVAWPNPRFVDNDDGTVTDMLTGLIWLKNANCYGAKIWNSALQYANTLWSGACGLSDGSDTRDWRLPSVNELQSLIDYEYSQPALSNAAGTEQWSEGNPFSGVQTNDCYWSSTTLRNDWSGAWHVFLFSGSVDGYGKSNNSCYVWPVRGGL